MSDLYTNVSGHKVMYYHRPFRRITHTYGTGVEVKHFMSIEQQMWKDDSPLKYSGCLRIDQQQFKSPFRAMLFIVYP